MAQANIFHADGSPARIAPSPRGTSPLIPPGFGGFFYALHVAHLTKVRTHAILCLGMVWVVAQTQPQREKLAAEYVQRQGYDTYLPMVREDVRENGKWVTRESILFPRYLFVQVVNRWRWLLSTRGVRSVVMMGDGPALLHHSIIRELKSRETNGFVVLPRKQRSARFRKGQRVRAEHDTLGSVVGLYAGMDSDEREHVLVNILGRNVRLCVESGSLHADA